MLHNNVLMANLCRRQQYSYLRLHVKCPKFLSDFNQTYEVSRYISVYVPNINFHGSLSIGSPTDILGQQSGQMDIAKLIHYLRAHPNAPKSDTWARSVCHISENYIRVLTSPA
jgi:hypothetical protein